MSDQKMNNQKMGNQKMGNQKMGNQKMGNQKMSPQQMGKRTRRDEILDVAEELFYTQGYEETSMEEILTRVGIAKGTLYHHFKSKEAIMDELIAGKGQAMLSRAEAMVNNPEIPGMQRLALALSALRMEDPAGGNMDYLHKPENALMHLKTERLILQEVPKILVRALKEDLENGVLTCSHPLLCMEMLVLYANTAFDHLAQQGDTEEEQQRLVAFAYAADTLFGARPGTFLEALQAAAEREK